MRINGQWLLCDDAVMRPVIQGKILTGDGSWQEAEFLVDTAADWTAFSFVLTALALDPVEVGGTLGGVGGAAQAVTVETRIEFLDERDSPIAFRGRFAAFTDPNALDMSVLGGDVINLFALIVDRPNEVVCMLGQAHHYQVVQNTTRS
jgi:hypothetical protein